jgi:hypothetical protein
MPYRSSKFPTEYIDPATGARMVLAFDKAQTDGEIMAAYVPATPEDAAKLPKRSHLTTTGSYLPPYERDLEKPYMGPNFPGDDQEEARLREQAGLASPYPDGRRLRDLGEESKTGFGASREVYDAAREKYPTAFDD